MNKKAFTALFMLVATIANMLMTVFVIVFLAAICILTLKVLKIQNENAALILVSLCFLGGLVLDMILYSKLTSFIIDKFHLETKLDKSVLGKKYASKIKDTEPPKPKTVLPASVLPKDEEDEWESRAYGEQTVSYTPLNPEDFAQAAPKQE